MTRALERAIAELQKLPAAEQDAIAALILEEIADDKQWDESFDNSQDVLEKLAEKAQRDIEAGRIKDMGIDEL
jgi:hypothetical protein